MCNSKHRYHEALSSYLRCSLFISYLLFFQQRYYSQGLDTVIIEIRWLRVILIYKKQNFYIPILESKKFVVYLNRKTYRVFITILLYYSIYSVLFIFQIQICQLWTFVSSFHVNRTHLKAKSASKISIHWKFLVVGYVMVRTMLYTDIFITNSLV